MKKIFPSLLVLIVLAAASAQAHTLSNSYLSVVVEGKTLTGRWDIAVRDLEFAVGLDSDDDGAITWKELSSRRKDIESLAFSSVKLALAGQNCALRPERFLLDVHSDGAYAVLLFSGAAAADVPETAPLSVRYDFLFDVDAQHRGLLNVSFRQETELRPADSFGAAGSLIQAMLAGQKVAAVFDPKAREKTFSRDLPDTPRQFGEFFKNGVWHIWIGYDHIAFLLVLLLPGVVLFRKGAWEAVDGFWPAFMNALKVVTAFSVAHSVTLSLAATGVIRLPVPLVEAVIAASIVWAAMRNIFPHEGSQNWKIAFAFGLVHGFGFANVLAEFDLPRGAILKSLLAFNLGVETGQLAIVSCFLPLAYALRKTSFYRNVAVRLGSAAIGVFGFIWFIERVFGLHIIS